MGLIHNTGVNLSWISPERRSTPWYSNAALSEFCSVSFIITSLPTHTQLLFSAFRLMPNKQMYHVLCSLNLLNSCTRMRRSPNLERSCAQFTQVAQQPYLQWLFTSSDVSLWSWVALLRKTLHCTVKLWAAIISSVKSSRTKWSGWIQKYRSCGHYKIFTKGPKISVLVFYSFQIFCLPIITRIKLTKLIFWCIKNI